jgi:diacylglycerol kinase (ATP)
MRKSPKAGIARQLIKSTGYAWHGLLAAFRWEVAFRLEVYLCLGAFPIALLLGKTKLERILLISSLLGVLAAELINSALEAVVDRIGLERDELAKRTKDLGAAVVFIAILNALLIWAILLIGRI